MAATLETSKWKRISLWLAPLIIALAVIAWSYYWSYLDKLEPEHTYASPSDRR